MHRGRACCMLLCSELTVVTLIVAVALSKDRSVTSCCVALMSADAIWTQRTIAKAYQHRHKHKHKHYARNNVAPAVLMSSLVCAGFLIWETTTAMWLPSRLCPWCKHLRCLACMPMLTFHTTPVLPRRYGATWYACLTLQASCCCLHAAATMMLF